MTAAKGTLQASLFGWGAVGAVAGLNALVALVAFLKDVWLAMYLGTSKEADAISLAFFIPDAVGNNLFAAAVGVVCVPLFARDAERAEAWRRTVAGALLWTCAAALALFTALLFAVPRLTELFAASGSGVDDQLTERLLRILLPTVLLFPLGAIGTAGLQSLGKFRRSAASPLLFNGLFLLSVWGCTVLNVDRAKGVDIVAWAIVLGVGLSVWLVREPLLEAARQLRRGAGRVPYLQLLLPYLLILLSAQAVYAVERYLAASMGPGVVAGLTYAFRLSQFPVWTLIAALTAVLLPALARENGDDDRQRATLGRALHYGIFITLPLGSLLWVYREPVISFLFQRGAFDGRSLELTSGIVAGYALTIPLQAVFLIGLRYFLARGELRIPVAITVAGAGMTIGADVWLAEQFGPAGLGYAAALGAAAQAAAMGGLLWKRLGLRSWFAASAAAMAANVPPFIAAYASARAIAAAGPEFWRTAAAGALYLAAYFIIYAGICRSLRRGVFP